MISEKEKIGIQYDTGKRCYWVYEYKYSTQYNYLYQVIGKFDDSFHLDQDWRHKFISIENGRMRMRKIVSRYTRQIKSSDRAWEWNDQYVQFFSYDEFRCTFFAELL